MVTEPDATETSKGDVLGIALGILGVLLVAAGIACWSVPAALIVVGLFILVVVERQAGAQRAAKATAKRAD